MTLRNIIVAAAAIILGAGAAIAAPLQSVEVAGNSRVETATIMLQINSSAGSELDPATVDRDVKEIYRTGFFEQVTAKVQHGAEGPVLVFQVLEKPALRKILIEGNEEIDDDTLREKLNIEARRFLDQRKITAGIEQAKSYYQEQGYYGTEISYSVTPLDDNEVDLTFNIKEGEEAKLREVRFEGNEHIDSSDLEDAIETSRYKWWSSWLTGTGVVKQDQLENDVRELTRYYLNHGYADIRVGEPAVTRTDDGLRVTFPIEEGQVYSFGDIRVAGDLIENSPAKTLEGIDSHSGDTFGIDKLRKDAFTVSDKFTDIGYAFANVEPDTVANREARTIDVVFNVDKGSLITVNRINISGNQKTADNVIRRVLKMQERQLYSSSKIRKSQQLLQRLGYFDEVTITPESAPTPNEVDLNVGVKEGNTGTFSAGAGVSSGEGFLINMKISENNLFGRGYSLALDVDQGNRNKNYVLSFENPRVNDSWWSAGIDLLSVEREFDDFDRDQTGGSISAGYPLAFLGEEYMDEIRFSLKYELLRITIDEIEDDAPQLIKDEEGRSTSSSITPRLVRNTIDNPLNPSRGSRQVGSVELAGIGGDEEFWLVQLSNSFYYPLWEPSAGPLVFAQRTRFDYGDTFNDDTFPLFRRFFPGGINSVRGFKSRELGPKDEEGNEFGGSKQLIGNFEIIFPLLSSLGLKGLVFYDIGNAFDDEDNISLGELRHAAGGGLRWNSPLGPIRIEIGTPLDREEGEQRLVTNFSFGAPL